MVPVYLLSRILFCPSHYLPPCTLVSPHCPLRSVRLDAPSPYSTFSGLQHGNGVMQDLLGLLGPPVHWRADHILSGA